MKFWKKMLVVLFAKIPKENKYEQFLFCLKQTKIKKHTHTVAMLSVYFCMSWWQKFSSRMNLLPRKGFMKKLRWIGRWIKMYALQGGNDIHRQNYYCLIYFHSYFRLISYRYTWNWPKTRMFLFMTHAKAFWCWQISIHD